MSGYLEKFRMEREGDNDGSSKPRSRARSTRLAGTSARGMFLLIQQPIFTNLAPCNKSNHLLCMSAKIPKARYESTDNMKSKSTDGKGDS
jgi:hypothetical protein